MFLLNMNSRIYCAGMAMATPFAGSSAMALAVVPYSLLSGTHSFPFHNSSLSAFWPRSTPRQARMRYRIPRCGDPFARAHNRSQRISRDECWKTFRPASPIQA